MKVKSLSRVRLLATPWTAAHQASLSMGFSRQEYWSEVPLPSLIVRIGRVKLESGNKGPYLFIGEELIIFFFLKGNGWTSCENDKIRCVFLGKISLVLGRQFLENSHARVGGSIYSLHKYL